MRSCVKGHSVRRAESHCSRWDTRGPSLPLPASSLNHTPTSTRLSEFGFKLIGAPFPPCVFLSQIRLCVSLVLKFSYLHHWDRPIIYKHKRSESSVTGSNLCFRHTEAAQVMFHEYISMLLGRATNEWSTCVHSSPMTHQPVAML